MRPIMINATSLSSTIEPPPSQKKSKEKKNPRNKRKKKEKKTLNIRGCTCMRPDCDNHRL